MKYTFFLFLSLFALSSFAQEKRDVGIMLGTSYYLGDYNNSFHFKQPQPALGLLFRYNYTRFYSFRGEASIFSVTGAHNPSAYYLPGETPKFESKFFAFDIVSEINFLPFDSRLKGKQNHSPYLALGASASFFEGKPQLHIPVGIGYKYALGNRISLSFEWTLRKTFSDKLDGYPNPTQVPRSIIHNNDWISVAGFSLFYRFYDKKALCPTYQ